MKSSSKNIFIEWNFFIIKILVLREIINKIYLVDIDYLFHQISVSNPYLKLKKILFIFLP